MLIEVGEVEAIFRYPVKSMAGERLEVANLGWHGLDADRRLALRRMDDRSGIPWLTASKLPDLLLFAPCPEMLLRESSLLISARRMARSWLFSARTWPRE